MLSQRPSQPPCLFFSSSCLFYMVEWWHLLAIVCNVLIIWYVTVPVFFSSVHYDEIKHILNNPTLTSQWGFVSTILTSILHSTVKRLFISIITDCICRFNLAFWPTPGYCNKLLHIVDWLFIKGSSDILFFYCSWAGCDVTQNTIGIPHSEVIMLISFLLSFSLVWSHMKNANLFVHLHE